MAFSAYEFDNRLREIEAYLGYLRGNENFIATWRSIYEALQPSDGADLAGYVPVDVWLRNYYDKVPCPEGRFAFTPNEGFFMLRLFVKPPWTEEDTRNYMREVTRSLDFAYEDGLAWASGLADYCRSVCDQITSPSVSVLAGAVRGIADQVVAPLRGTGETGPLSDDWALVGSVIDDWQGSAGNQAAALYQGFNSTLGSFGQATGWMNFGVCAFAHLVRDVQTGLAGSVEKVHHALVEQLDEWVDIGHPPSSEPEPLPGWIADVTLIAGDAITIIKDKVPVIGNIVDKVDSAVTEVEQWKKLADDLETVTGFEVLPKVDKPVYLRTADDIYSGLTSALYDDYYQRYREALDSLQSGSLPQGLPTPEDARADQPVFSGRGLLDQLDASAAATTFPRVGSGSVASGESY